MPTTNEDLAKVQAAAEKARGVAKEASGLYASAETFGPDVMKMVRESRASRGMSQLDIGQGQALGQMATEPAGIRARTADVNPLDVDVLTAGQRGQTLSTLGSLASQEAGISGTVEDVIGAGTSKVKAMAVLKQAEAEEAANQAEELIALAEFRAKREEEAFQRQMSERGMSLAERKFAYDKTQGGEDDFFQKWLESQQGGAGQAPQPTEPEPNYSPRDMSKGMESMEGQWYYDPGKKAWRVLQVIATGPSGDIYTFDGFKDPDIQKYEQMGYTTELKLY